MKAKKSHKIENLKDNALALDKQAFRTRVYDSHLAWILELSIRHLDLLQENKASKSSTHTTSNNNTMWLREIYIKKNY